MDNLNLVIQKQASDALQKLNVRDIVTVEYIIDSVQRQIAYWEKPISNGEKLLFIRFLSPVVQREEVFLGSILLNAFLSKTFVQAITEGQLGNAELIANDVDNYYFLIRTNSNVVRLADVFRAEVEHSLPNLYLGEQNSEKGIYGSMETMLDFDKANVEPFPIFVMPEAYAERLEKAVRESLKHKIRESPLDHNPTSIMANLAFFYSKDGEEMQSPSKFLGHLAFQYAILSPTQLEISLNIPCVEKLQVIDNFNSIIDEEKFAEDQKGILNNLIEFIDNNLSTPYRFGWLEIFFDKTEKGAWVLDVGKPKDQKPVEKLLSRIKAKKPRSILKPEDLFDEIVKGVIAYRLSKISACSLNDLRDLMENAITKLGEKVDLDSRVWLMPYVRSKFISKDEKYLTESILENVSLGFIMLKSIKNWSNEICRLCGVSLMEVEDKSILMGQNTHKFHNQSGKRKNEREPKACLRCAICTYLMVKLIGSEAVGQPQVPKTYNLIFHYGKHDDEEVDQVARQIDHIWNLVKEHINAEQINRDIAKQLRELRIKYDREKNTKKKQELAKSVDQKLVELQQARNEVSKVEGGIIAFCPWIKKSDASPVPAENCYLDAFANIQASDSKVKRHILGLGMGGYRMILFLLPQIRAPRDAKEHDFAQRRFSDSRVTVASMLSFLRQLCGCDGPFYYQSLPTLTPDGFNPDTFYIHNEPISVHQAQNEYDTITQLAWKLIKQRGSEGFVRKVVLAEKLLEDPLGTFSAVMRDSAILGQSKGTYRILRGSSLKNRDDWGSPDLTEYAKFIKKLSKLEE